MIKAIIFDAFGTLFKVTGGASARTIISHIEKAGVAVDESAFLKEWKSFYKEKTSDTETFLTEREIFISRIKMFYDRYGVMRSAKKDADYLLCEAHQRKVYEDTLPALENLKKNYLLFVGSNTDNSVLDSVIHLNGVKIHKAYTSENLKCYKPSLRFYKQILEENGLAPDEVFFVGDSLTDDIWGPKQCGINTCWINRTNADAEKHTPDFTIETLLEIEQCLKTYK